MRDVRTVGVAALTAFMVAAMVSPAAGVPHPVPAPKHCSIKLCPPAEPLNLRVDELQREVFTLKAEMSCFSKIAPLTPDVDGNVHPLVKWRKSCVGMGGTG